MMRKIFYKATHFCSSLLCIICCSLVVQISASTDKSNSLILQSFDRTVFYRLIERCSTMYSQWSEIISEGALSNEP